MATTAPNLVALRATTSGATSNQGWSVAFARHNVSLSFAAVPWPRAVSLTRGGLPVGVIGVAFHHEGFAEIVDYLPIFTALWSAGGNPPQCLAEVRGLWW